MQLIDEVTKINNLAKEKYGVTENFDYAGYLLIDGEMLDFSEGQSMRTLDHRDINNILDVDGYNDGLITFMNYGNIRIGFCGFDISKPPTKAQEHVLTNFINYLIKKRGDCYIDISDVNGREIKSFSYTIGVHAAKILKDINDYFKVLEKNVHDKEIKDDELLCEI